MAVNREQGTRDATSRKKAWKPPSLLPTPNAEPGYKFRWVRVSSQGDNDNRNVSKRFREGWEPVAAKDHPEIQFVGERGSEFQGGIEIGGLLLCKTAAENVQQRSEYYNARAQDQMNSVENSFLRDNDPRMPKYKLQNRTRVSFGTGGQD
jgi:hypothetical protein